VLLQLTYILTVLIVPIFVVIVIVVVIIAVAYIAYSQVDVVLSYLALSRECFMDPDSFPAALSICPFVVVLPFATIA
jgi:hypothetical protein